MHLRRCAARVWNDCERRGTTRCCQIHRVLKIPLSNCRIVDCDEGPTTLPLPSGRFLDTKAREGITADDVAGLDLHLDQTGTLVILEYCHVCHHHSPRLGPCANRPFCTRNVRHRAVPQPPAVRLPQPPAAPLPQPPAVAPPQTPAVAPLQTPAVAPLQTPALPPTHASQPAAARPLARRISRDRERPEGWQFKSASAAHQMLPVQFE